MTRFQKFFLSILFPVLLLGGFELAARGLHSFGLRLSETPDELELDMPSWMAASKGKARKYSAKELEWMGYFENGDGFRVRLRPDIKVWFHDTFSWLKGRAGAGFTVTSNALGFRGWEIPEKQSGRAFRVMIFGDSSSFGWGVNYEDSYAAQMKEQLERKYPGKSVQVLNFAMPGDSSVFGKLIFDKYIDSFDADAVIFSFGANDSRQARLPHKKQIARYQEKAVAHALRETLAEKSAFFQDFEVLMQRLLATAEEKKKGPRHTTVAVPIKQYKNNLSKMVREVRSRYSSKILLLGVCSPMKYRNTMKLVAEQDGVGFLDAQALLRSSIDDLEKEVIYAEEVKELKKTLKIPLRQQPLLYVSSDGCHPNNIGHKIIAGEITDYLISSGI